MPKAKTLLDELARTLKARNGAEARLDRRMSDWPEPAMRNKAIGESRTLIHDLGDKAVVEYDRIMRSGPSRIEMRKAYHMMPSELVRGHDYFDR